MLGTVQVIMSVATLILCLVVFYVAHRQWPRDKTTVDISRARDRIESHIKNGLRDQKISWHLAHALTANFPPDHRVDALRWSIVDLLVAIEMENILGGLVVHHQEKLYALLDWVEKHQPRPA